MNLDGVHVGAGYPCYAIAECGINHGGDLATAKRLITQAAIAGCQAVKFQKRTVDVVYTQEELDRPRESPFGTTNGDLKHGLELSLRDYAEIHMHCREQGIQWFASCWDKRAVDEMDTFAPPCFKIASACLTDHDLISHTCGKMRPIILSTGMSTMDEIDDAVRLINEHGNELAILHCTSTYPAATAELNLRCIPLLAERFGGVIGYSGHEVGLQTSVAAVALGAKIIERHITLDRASFGSDQAASIEPSGLIRLVRDIRNVEVAMGDGIKRVHDSELPIRDKLRRVPA